jgi:hypothetical protein
MPWNDALEDATLLLVKNTVGAWRVAPAAGESAEAPVVPSKTRRCASAVTRPVVTTAADQRQPSVPST